MEKQETQKQKVQELKGKFYALRQQVNPILMARWQEQQQLVRNYIIEKNDFNWTLNNLTYVAGVDLSASKINSDFACVSLIVYNMQTSKVEYEDSRLIQINQPYIPGFLAFREVPPLFQQLTYLRKTRPQIYPQLILLDGNGILHSNYCGLASHLGVLLDTPTIGVGKTLFYIDGLTKDKVKEQCKNQILKAGDYSLLKGDSGKIWGAGLRNTEAAINPIFVSIGTKIQLQFAIQIVKKLSFFRVVEPIRLADKRSRQIIQKTDIKKLQKGQITYQKFEMVYLKQLLKN